MEGTIVSFEKLSPSCSDPEYTTEISCEAAGTCSDNQYTTKESCENANATWSKIWVELEEGGSPVKPKDIKIVVNVATAATAPENSSGTISSWWVRTVGITNNNHNWNENSATAHARDRLGLKLDGQPYVLSNPGYNSTNNLNTAWHTKEYQEVSFYKQDLKDKGVKQLDLYPSRGETVNPNGRDKTEECHSDGYWRYAECPVNKDGNKHFTWDGEWNAKVGDAAHLKNKFYVANQTPWKQWGAIPMNEVKTTFPGNGEYEKLGKELDEQLGKHAKIYSKIYIDEIGAEYSRKGTGAIGATARLIHDTATNAMWEDYTPAGKPWGHDHPKAVVDLHRFYDKYVYHDFIANSNGTAKSNWELNGNYWDCWHAAYEEGVKGSYILSGTGFNKAEANASLSGQFGLYLELINKFHFTGSHDRGTNDSAKNVLSAGQTEDYTNNNTNNVVTWKGVLASGVACTVEDATKNAVAHLDWKLRNWVSEEFTSTQLQGMCEHPCIDPASPDPCLIVRSGYLNTPRQQDGSSELAGPGEDMRGTVGSSSIKLEKSDWAGNESCHWQIAENGGLGCKWKPTTPYSGSYTNGTEDACVHECLIAYNGALVDLRSMGCSAGPSGNDSATKDAARDSLKAEIEAAESEHCKNGNGWGIGWLEAPSHIVTDNLPWVVENNKPTFGKYETAAITNDQNKNPHWVDTVNWGDWVTRAGQGGQVAIANSAGSAADYIGTNETGIMVVMDISAPELALESNINLFWNTWRENYEVRKAYGNYDAQGNLPWCDGETEAGKSNCTECPITGTFKFGYTEAKGFGFVIGGNADSSNGSWYLEYGGSEGVGSERPQAVDGFKLFMEDSTQGWSSAGGGVSFDDTFETAVVNTEGNIWHVVEPHCVGNSQYTTQADCENNGQFWEPGGNSTQASCGADTAGTVFAQDPIDTIPTNNNPQYLPVATWLPVAGFDTSSAGNEYSLDPNSTDPPYLTTAEIKTWNNHYVGELC